MTDSIPDPMSGLISTIREQRFVLDTDLARLYGVPIKQFNEAFKRHRVRFPKEIAFQITREELPNLRSQVATSGS
jgi:ORF6N domain